MRLLIEVKPPPNKRRFILVLSMFNFLLLVLEILRFNSLFLGKTPIEFLRFNFLILVLVRVVG